MGRPADTPQWGRCHAPIKSRRSVLTSVVGTTHKTNLQQRRQGAHEPDHRDQDSNHGAQRRRTSVTLR
jgi:hypothetical protein